MQFRRAVIGLAAAMLLASGGAAQAVDHGGASAGSDGVPAYRITAPNGATSTLIGSLHIPAEGLRQPDGQKVMKGARRYVVESAAPADANHLEPMMLFAPEFEAGESLRAHWAAALTDDQIELLRERVACNEGVSKTPEVARAVTDIFLAFKSPVLASQFAIRPCPSDPSLLSRDDILADAAKAAGLPIIGLETPEEATRQRMKVPTWHGASISTVHSRRNSRKC